VVDPVRIKLTSAKVQTSLALLVHAGPLLNLL
jgi:hypothetical protein